MIDAFRFREMLNEQPKEAYRDSLFDSKRENITSEVCVYFERRFIMMYLFVLYHHVAEITVIVVH